MEKFYDFGKDIPMCIVDFRQTYDSIKRGKLFESYFNSIKLIYFESYMLIDANSVSRGFHEGGYTEFNQHIQYLHSYIYSITNMLYCMEFWSPLRKDRVYDLHILLSRYGTEY